MRPNKGREKNFPIYKNIQKEIENITKIIIISMELCIQYTICDVI